MPNDNPYKTPDAAMVAAPAAKRFWENAAIIATPIAVTSLAVIVLFYVSCMDYEWTQRLEDVIIPMLPRGDFPRLRVGGVAMVIGLAAALLVMAAGTRAQKLLCIIPLLVFGLPVVWFFGWIFLRLLSYLPAI